MQYQQNGAHTEKKGNKTMRHCCFRVWKANIDLIYSNKCYFFSFSLSVDLRILFRTSLWKMGRFWAEIWNPSVKDDQIDGTDRKWHYWENGRLNSDYTVMAEIVTITLHYIVNLANNWENYRYACRNVVTLMCCLEFLKGWVSQYNTSGI